MARTFVAYKMSNHWQVADVKNITAEQIIDYQNQQLKAVVKIDNKSYPIEDFKGLILVYEDDRKIQYNMTFILDNTASYQKDLKNQQEKFKYNVDLFNERINVAINKPEYLSFSGPIADSVPNEVGVFFKFNNVGKFYKSHLESLEDHYKEAKTPDQKLYLQRCICEEKMRQEYINKIDAENPIIA